MAQEDAPTTDFERKIVTHVVICLEMKQDSTKIFPENWWAINLNYGDMNDNEIDPYQGSCVAFQVYPCGIDEEYGKATWYTYIDCERLLVKRWSFAARSQFCLADVRRVLHKYGLDEDPPHAGRAAVNDTRRWIHRVALCMEEEGWLGRSDIIGIDAALSNLYLGWNAHAEPWPLEIEHSDML